MNILLKKIKYQCAHRGTRELDLILKNFMEKNGESLSEEQLQTLEVFLETPEHQLTDWLLKGIPSSDPTTREVISWIKE